MPVNIGPRIGIEGEDKYRKQILNLVQQTKTLEAQMKALASASDKETSSQEKAAKAVKLLTEQQTKQEARVKLLSKMVAESAKETSETSTQTLKWKQALAEAENELNKTNSQLEEAQRAADGFGDEIADSANQMDTFNEAAVMMARQQIADTLNRAAEAAANFGKKALGGVISVTKDFDSAMSNVKALSGATGSEFDALRQKARDTGAATKYSATESADALGYMALAGWDTNQMIEGLDGVLNLAAASGMELAEASDIVTDFLGAFGKEAKDAGKMADMMAYAQAHSNTTTRQLGEAFRNSAANMHTAGQSMETTTALLEAMANQGNKGSEAGTALAAMMRDLTQKMKNGKIAIGNTSIQVMDANGNFRNMIDILADVEAATNGMGTAEKSAALMTTFTARSVKGVNQVLTEGSANLRQYETALKNSTGAAGEMAETMQDNLEGQLTILKSQMQELAISVGDQLTPYIRKGVEIVQSIIDKFNSMPDGVKKAVAVLLSVGTVTAIVVPKMLSFINTIRSLQSASAVIKGVKQMNSQISETGEVSSKANTSLSSLAKGVGIAATAVTAGVAAVKAINGAIKDWRMENDEAYASVMKLKDATEKMAGEADDYGDYIGELTDELKAEGEMEMSTADRAKSAAQKYAAAQSRKEEAQKQLVIAKQKLIEITGSEAKAEEALRRGTIQQNNATYSLMRSLDGLYGKQTGSVDAYNALITTIQKYEGETKNADGLLDALTQTMIDNGYTLEEATALANDFGGAVDVMSDDVEVAAEEVEQSFMDIWRAAKDEFTKTLNIMEEWADDSALTMDKFAEIMANNAKAWANWSDNIDTLTKDARYETDENFRAIVDNLISMEGKGAVALQGFADAVRKNDNAAIKSWSDLAGSATKAKDKVTTQLATLRARSETENKKIASSFAGLVTATNTNTNQMVQALTGKEPAVRTAMGNINRAITSNYPNKAAAVAAAANAGQGLVDGLNSKKDAAGNAASGVSSRVNTNIKPNYSGAYAAGVNAVDGLAKGISDRGWFAVNAAGTVATNAINRTRYIMQERSPSKVFEQIGRYMVEGMAIGLKDTRPVDRAIDAMKGVAITPMMSLDAVHGSGSVSNHNLTYGDIVVNVSGANVSNEDALARKISDTIFRQVKAQKAVFA